MEHAVFQFGNVVVVEGDLIGVIVKSWGPSSKTGKYSHEVYVRMFNGIKDYPEEEIRHFIYSKELTEEDKTFY